MVEKSTELVLDTVDCGSVLGEFSTLDINCDEGSLAHECELTVGKKYTGSLKVTPNTIINNGTIVLHAEIAGASLPFPFPDNNLCEDHDINCPLKPDKEVVVSITLPVPSFAPAVNFLAKMEFKSGDKDLVCVEFLGKIGS